MKNKMISFFFRPVPKLNFLILATNVIYIIASLLTICKNNQEFFFENAFQVVNLYFYAIVLLSFLLIRNTKFYFLISLVFVIDLPVSLKLNLQNLVGKYLHLTGAPWNPLVTYALLFCIFGVTVLLIFKYRALRYFQVYLLLFYIITFMIVLFKPLKINDPSIRVANHVSVVSKNYYFLLFDEYPNEQIIKSYNICGPRDYPSALLTKAGFENDRNVHSDFIGTERSTLTFLTGSFQSGYNVNKAIHAIYKNSFTGSPNYSFREFSLFDNRNRPNSEFSILYFKEFNNLLTRKIIPYAISLFNKRGMGRYTNWDWYNARALVWLDTISRTQKLQVVYIHFYTPHYYPLVWGQSLSDRIKNANGWMQKAVGVIDQHDPKAGVIIFSDHGLRIPAIPFQLWNRNILYYRNVRIDTALVNKNGLVDLIKSIKYQQ
ncbi:MAG TPA: hypothetical protein VHC47_03655 [Mucilaginibacter sp.]|nr:hypothetical protein [Mucilaginibacter sp.]